MASRDQPRRARGAEPRSTQNARGMGKARGTAARREHFNSRPSAQEIWKTQRARILPDETLTSTDLDSKPSQLLRTGSNEHGFNLIVTGIRFTHLGWLKPRVMRLPRADHTGNVTMNKTMSVPQLAKWVLASAISFSTASQLLASSPYEAAVQADAPSGVLSLQRSSRPRQREYQLCRGSGRPGSYQYLQPARLSRSARWRQKSVPVLSYRQQLRHGPL